MAEQCFVYMGQSLIEDCLQLDGVVLNQKRIAEYLFGLCGINSNQVEFVYVVSDGWLKDGLFVGDGWMDGWDGMGWMDG